MVTIISGTNRKKSNSYNIALTYHKILAGKNISSLVLSLEELPEGFPSGDTFGKRTKAFSELIEKYIINSEKLIFIIPEYNGSYPGILKLFFEAFEEGEGLTGKKAAVVGIASGRAGNLRGMDHLTDILHHLRVEVLSNKLPISNVNEILSDEGELNDIHTQQLIKNQIQDLMLF